MNDEKLIGLSLAILSGRLSTVNDMLKFKYNQIIIDMELFYQFFKELGFDDYESFDYYSKPTIDEIKLKAEEILLSKLIELSGRVQNLEDEIKDCVKNVDYDY